MQRSYLIRDQVTTQAAYAHTKQGDAYLAITIPKPQPKARTSKKEKLKRKTAVGRYLQWLDWDQKTSKESAGLFCGVLEEA
jgi:hypothetical protein